MEDPNGTLHYQCPACPFGLWSEGGYAAAQKHVDTSHEGVYLDMRFRLLTPQRFNDSANERYGWSRHE